MVRARELSQDTCKLIDDVSHPSEKLRKMRKSAPLPRSPPSDRRRLSTSECGCLLAGIYLLVTLSQLPKFEVFEKATVPLKVTITTADGKQLASFDAKPRVRWPSLLRRRWCEGCADLFDQVVRPGRVRPAPHSSAAPQESAVRRNAHVKLTVEIEGESRELVRALSLALSVAPDTGLAQDATVTLNIPVTGSKLAEEANGDDEA
jgi:hypothetical protein